MKKKGIVFAVSLALLPVIVQPSVALAEEKASSADNSYVELSVSDLKSMFSVAEFKNYSVLSQSKENELDKLTKDAKLSNEDVQFLKKQYLKYHPTNQLETSKWKVSVIKKAIKAAVPLVKRAAKAAGVKVSEAKISDGLDVLYGYQGDIENGVFRKKMLEYWLGV